MENVSRKQKLDEQIDDNLRRAYQEVAKEEVPERFIKLLEELRRQDDRANITKPVENPKESK